jgi:hypothetical protein
MLTELCSKGDTDSLLSLLSAFEVARFEHGNGARTTNREVSTRAVPGAGRAPWLEREEYGDGIVVAVLSLRDPSIKETLCRR